MALTTTKALDFEATAILCDGASVAEGKLYLLGGGWDRLSPPTGSYPTQLPRIALALLITVPYTATNRNHTLTIRLQGPDGESIPIARRVTPGSGGNPQIDPINEMSANFNIGRPPFLAEGDAQHVPLAINIDGLIIERPDAYSFVIEIDDHEITRVVFHAMSAPPQMSMMGL